MSYTVTREPGYSAGVFKITFNTAHPDGAHYVINVTAQLHHWKIWEINEPTSTTFWVVMYNNNMTQLANQDFYFNVLA